MRLRVICIALLAPGLALSACEPSHPPSGQAKSGVTGQATETVVFPDVFPSYITLYPGAQNFDYPGTGITNAMISKLAKGGSASFLTTDSADKVLTFYRGEFEKAGLKGGDPESKPKLEMLTYIKEEPVFETVSVVVTKLPPQSNIVQILYMPVPDAVAQK
jgi:hypothetical protein